jgi:hypothetical protein
MSTYRTYNLTGIDNLFAIDASDATYLYIGGYLNGGADGAVMLKLAKSDLSVNTQTRVSSTSSVQWNTALLDGSNLFLSGFTSAGVGVVSGLIGDYTTVFAQNDQHDFGIVSGRHYFNGACQDDDYIYAAGWTSTETVSKAAILVQISKADLSIVATSRINDVADANADEFQDCCISGGYVYAVGQYNSADAMIVKFDIADLSVSANYRYYKAAKTYLMNGCCTDGTSVYACGTNTTDLLGTLLKVACADLSLSSAVDSSTVGAFKRCVVSGGNVYVIGSTTAEGAGSSDIWMFKASAADLSKSVGKVFGGANADYGFSVACDGTNVYWGGRLRESDTGSAFVIKTGLSLDVAAGLTSYPCVNSAATFDAGGLTGASISPTVATSALVSGTQAMTVAAITFTVSGETALTNNTEPPVGGGGGSGNAGILISRKVMR